MGVSGYLRNFSGVYGVNGQEKYLFEDALKVN